MKLDSGIQSYLTTHRWALQRRVLDSLCGVIERHIAGEKLTDEQIDRIASARKPSADDPRKYEVLSDGTAVIRISGVIAKYSSMVNDVSQPRGTSIEFLSDQLSLVLSDSRAERIFLSIESPGGSMPGLPDFADQVYQASFQKPVIAFADDEACSAAYWIGSQANAFFANQSAMVGSIGVYMVIPDSSKRAEMMGVRFNVIKTGENKGAGYPGSEVTHAQLAAFQDEIDSDFQMFLSAVLRGRMEKGLSSKTLALVADGRVYNARQAVEHRLIDGVMTMTEALSVANVQTRTDNAAASAEANTVFNGKDTPMSEKKLETTKAPADAAETPNCGIEQERSRILAIQSALAGPELAELSRKAVAEGWDLTKAKAEAFVVVQQARKADQETADKKATELQTRLDAIANSGHAGELIPQADTTPTTPLAGGKSGGGSAAAYQEAFDGLKKSGLSDAQAHRKLARTHAADKAAWLSAQQK